ncbi:MAG: hypothetical protein FWH36_03385 [Lentimicrobiaceae bacterium]|nr:hypothetical protein [Lentimicrobiaceae bacterium]
MSKVLKNNVLAGAVVLVFVGMVVAGCSKYDKMSILGEWAIDLKAAQNLNVDSAKETLLFMSGSDQKYTQWYYKREVSPTSWTLNGHFERKNNKITFSDRVKDGSGEQLKPETYKYRIEDDKLILIVPGEGFKNDEKIYTKSKNKEE